MFNELSNFILHCVTVYTTVPRRGGGGGGNIGGYSDLRKHIKTRENCYPLIYSRNNNLYSKFHFSKRYKPTKAEHRNEFHIFQQEKRGYMAGVYIIEVHEIIYNIHSNITPHFELIIYKFI